MDSEQKRMFLAILLSGVVLFGWQAFVETNKPLETEQSTIVGDQVVVGGSKSDSASNKVGNSAASSSTIKASATESSSVGEDLALVVKEQYHLTGEQFKYVLNNHMDVEDVSSSNAAYGFRSIVGPDKIFELLVADGSSSYKKVTFDRIKSDQNQIIGKNSQFGINITYSFNEDGKLGLKIVSSKPYRYRFIFNSTAEDLGNQKLRQFVFLTKEVERLTVGDDALQSEGTLQWMGIDHNLHLFGLVFKERITGKISISESGKMVLESTQPYDLLDTYFIFAKKNYDTLEQLGDNLHLAVDFGILGVIAVPLLRGLQFFYKYIPNYGVAIVLLTIFIRLLLFPLQYKSYASMKKMQKVQPELTKLKEKYKDDPQKMQKETMDLFKRAGANPLGGCFPLLLQMPVFFAFYRVLYGAVELIGAPFFGWIGDLSVKDPYYVLPVLMAAAMLLQTKLNPSAGADPNQKRIMLFMPLIFGVIMKDLPSGLVLYIFVSTIFGIIQQMFVYKVTE
jgi:YidC/Oxa1 family membrane protein insertase